MTKLYLLLAALVILIACNIKDKKMTMQEIEIFKGTKVWELAKAVKNEDTVKIRLLVDKSNIDFQDPHFGATLLSWAVFNEKYNAAKALAELGANPNIQLSDYASSALTYAAGNYENSAFLTLLIEHSADVNAVLKGQNQYMTPLFRAAQVRLENVKILVKAGANVNYVSPDSSTAVIEATIMRRMDIVHYLIIDCKADFKTTSGITDKIFEWFMYDKFLEDTTDHLMKMEILEHMRQNGADYWAYLEQQKKEKEQKK